MTDIWDIIHREIPVNVLAEEDFQNLIKHAFLITAVNGRAAYEEIQQTLNHPETLLREKIFKELERIEDTRYVNINEKAEIATILIRERARDFRGTLLRILRNFIEKDNKNQVCRLRPVSAVYHMYFRLLPEKGDDLARIFDLYAKDEIVPENKRRTYRTIAFYLRDPDMDYTPEDYPIVREFFELPPLQKKLTEFS